MEYNKSDILRKQIYANTIFESGGTGVYHFIHSDGAKRNVPENDFYINLNLQRTYNVYEYVDTKKQENIYSIQRQNFNPYFIEQNFFKDTHRIKTTDGKSLTPKMIQILKSEYFANAYTVHGSFPIESFFRTTSTTHNWTGAILISMDNHLTSPEIINLVVNASALRIKDNTHTGIYPWLATQIYGYPSSGGTIFIGPYIAEGSFNSISGWQYTPPVNDNNGFDQVIFPGGTIEFVTPNFAIPQTDDEIREWFDKVGKNEIPSFSHDENEFTLDTLEKADLLFNNVVSHSMFYPIKINK